VYEVKKGVAWNEDRNGSSWGRDEEKREGSAGKKRLSIYSYIIVLQDLMEEPTLPVISLSSGGYACQCGV